MRAAAFAPEVARLLGVRVGRMFTLGWALAAAVGAVAGVLVAPSVFVGPDNFEPILIFAFVAAVLGGLDSPFGAIVGGLILGLALSYVSGYEGSCARPPGGARAAGDHAHAETQRTLLDEQRAPGVSDRVLEPRRGLSPARRVAQQHPGAFAGGDRLRRRRPGRGQRVPQ